jgi:hypothetical protein
MKPIAFPSNTTPWRVEVPSRYFADGKRKAKYFATKQAAEEFIQRLKKFGTGALDDHPLAKVWVKDNSETGYEGVLVNFYIRLTTFSALGQIPHNQRSKFVDGAICEKLREENGI